MKLSNDDIVGKIPEAEVTGIDDNTVTLKDLDQSPGGFRDFFQGVEFRIPFAETPDIKMGRTYRVLLVPVDGDT